MSEIKVGDRVWLLSVGWDCATVLKLEPLTIQFDNLEKAVKVPESEMQWLSPFIDYPMPKPGDTIKISDKHFVCGGKKFIVAKIQDGGWIKTTDGNLFHFDFFEIDDNQISTMEETSKPR